MKGMKSKSHGLRWIWGIEGWTVSVALNPENPKFQTEVLNKEDLLGHP